MRWMNGGGVAVFLKVIWDVSVLVAYVFAF